MRTWAPYAKYPFAAVIVLMLSGVCLAQQPLRRGRLVEGFKDLKWGTTTGEAQAVYPDLYFDRYAILHGKESPSKVYLRKAGGDVIETFAFDSAEYWFKDDRFHRIRATMHSKIGPRTLVTRAEEGFGMILGILTREYGEPSKYDTAYVSEIIAVVKKASWKAGDVTIVLGYEGPRDSNADRLTIEIGKN